MTTREWIARGLGVFSLGLGAWQLGGTRHFVRSIGAPDTDRSRTVARLVGARELVAAFGLLTRRKPEGVMASRVMGDLMDLGLLAGASGRRGSQRDRLGVAATAVAGIAAIDLVTTTGLPRVRKRIAARRQRDATPLRTAITIRRSPEELYAFWRQLENLPRFMKHLESVSEDGERSHWVAKAPLGRVEWDAEITEDRPNELIAWRSSGISPVRHEGRVEFRPAPRGQGTELRVLIDYTLPGGPIASVVAGLTGEEPQQQVSDDLRHLKQILEAGEVVRSEATLKGNRMPQRPARPPKPEELEQALAASAGSA